jgi:hypothetical protein
MWKPTKFYLQNVLGIKVRRHCGPIFFTHSIKTALGNIVGNGSFGLVDTGKKKVLVTCAHVWREFVKEREKVGDLKMCICLDRRNPLVFDERLLIDVDERTDLATFNFELYMPALGGMRLFDLTRYPPPKVARGDILLLIGFPGHQRKEFDEATRFGRQAFGVGLSSVNDFGFQADVSNLKLAADRYGGISGCPCFLAKEHGPLRLAGFTTGYVLDNLFFTHSDQLNVDGTVKHPAR